MVRMWPWSSCACTTSPWCRYLVPTTSRPGRTEPLDMSVADRSRHGDVAPLVPGANRLRPIGCRGQTMRHDGVMSPFTGTTDPTALSLFSGPGDSLALLRSRDWSATPLGPGRRWRREVRGGGGEEGVFPPRGEAAQESTRGFGRSKSLVRSHEVAIDPSPRRQPRDRIHKNDQAPEGR